MASIERTLKHMLTEFEKEPLSERRSGIEYPDPKNKKPDATDDAAVQKKPQIPEYLKDLDDDFSNVSVKTSVADLADAAHSDIIKSTLAKLLVEFKDELENVQPAPFTKDGELNEELEARFKLLKKNLILNFEKDKAEILASTEANLTQLIYSVLAKNGTYQRLSTAYATYMEDAEQLIPERKYDYKALNNAAIHKYADTKDEYLSQISEQYDSIHLPELYKELEGNLTAFNESIVDQVEEKVQPTKLALANALKPELNKRKIAEFNKMVTKLDLLENANSNETQNAIDAFKRIIRRESRKLQSLKPQIAVSDFETVSHIPPAAQPSNTHASDFAKPYVSEPVSEQPALATVTATEPIAPTADNAFTSPSADLFGTESFSATPVDPENAPENTDFINSLDTALNSHEPYEQVSPIAAPIPEPVVTPESIPEADHTQTNDAAFNPEDVFAGLNAFEASDTPTESEPIDVQPKELEPEDKVEPEDNADSEIPKFDMEDVFSGLGVLPDNTADSDNYSSDPFGASAKSEPVDQPASDDTKPHTYGGGTNTDTQNIETITNIFSGLDIN